MSTKSLFSVHSRELSFMTRLMLCVGAGALACSTEPTDEPAEVEVEVETAPAPAPGPDALADGEVVASRVDVRDGRSYTRTKLRAADGSVTTVVRDDVGGPIDADEVPSFVLESIDPELERVLADGPDGARVDVVLVLRSDVEENTARPGSARVDLAADRAPHFFVDGARSSAAAVQRIQDRMFADLSRQADARIARRRAALDELARRHGWDRDASLTAARRDPQGWIARSLTRAEVAAVMATSADLVERIERAHPAAPSVAAGLASIGVDSWAHAQGVRGAGVGVFMSEAWGNCPISPYIDATRFTNLTGASEHWHADIVGEVLRATAPHAHIYCGSYMIGNPNAYWPPIRVTNHSWRYLEEGNAYGAADRDFDDAVYNNRLAVFVAAGNVDDGTQTWNVASPARGFNALSVGNYDAATNQMNGGSRHLNPNTGAEKPEIAAPGTNVATALGWATGTSLSSPFSAGFAADLMSQYTWLQGHPELIKAMMMAGATRNIEGAAALSGLDGAGGLSYLNTAYSGSLTWWWGPNNSTFDAANRVTLSPYLTAGQRYRMSVVWLVPGSYAYSNNNVNMDIDMWVNDSNGGYVAGSYSYDNGFEIVDFVAPTTGTYTVTLNRFWNSGVGDVIMGHHIQAVL